MSNLQHYIKYTELVEDREKHKFVKIDTESAVPTRLIQSLIFPKNCVKFSFYDRLKIDDKSIYELGRDTYDEKMNESPTYYIGKEYSRDAVALALGDNSSLYQEMDDLLAERAVRVFNGEFLILGNKDKQEIVLSPSQVRFKDEKKSQEYAQTR